ncbi:hypothetical protein TNCV_4640321 [Trichonephila clavipes]|nr:hypothetical protein TNCV_4640321 [Trichonephila clavipes]
MPFYTISKSPNLFWVFYCSPGSLKHPQGGIITHDLENSRQAISPLVRLVEGEDIWESPDHPRTFSLKIGVETCYFVDCMVLKAAANDRRHLAFCHDQLREP